MKGTREKEREKEIRKDRTDVDEHVDANPDPITGEPGSHPVGVAAGGTGGAATGAAIGGAVGGPVGAAVGAAVGAVAGGLAGKGVAEAVNPSEEDEYWEKNYRTRPYYREGRTYDHYRPAYRFGWESATRPEFRDRSYDDIEDQLSTEWPSYHDAQKDYEYSEYRDAARDAYERARQRKDQKE